MMAHARLSFCLLVMLAGCAETNARRVDGARPATGCRTTPGTNLQSRFLQDVEGGGCLVISVSGSGGVHYPHLEQTVDVGIDIGLSFVQRFPFACAQLVEPVEVASDVTPDVVGWMSIERVIIGTRRTVFLNASFDVPTWSDPEVPAATVRIENMDINEREGWIECASFF